ncbi:hypothetical protein BD847_0130 [Flavobacterium cutihirudinis]|uniref:Uncharacterized protein n=1 Tax=Flavobacterium cutihirudinis TaxID=1265740 RepID=A0A3D9FZ10_9FLAO|nr:hypothetical protein [Flavobacterium cutihirudinis]RED26215.1 hypothetical protein BD847_0130 [Flavobacterium cutihirudinis]
MKEVILKLTFCLALLISSAGFAQGFNKKTLTAALGATQGVSLDNKQKNAYDKANADLVAGLTDLDKKNLSKKERDSQIDNLFDKRDKSLASSLGADKYSDVKKKTDKNINSVKRKVKLAKLVI